jgi:hypothetical protein
MHKLRKMTSRHLWTVILCNDAQDWNGVGWILPNIAHCPDRGDKEEKGVSLIQMAPVVQMKWNECMSHESLSVL